MKICYKIKRNIYSFYKSIWNFSFIILHYSSGLSYAIIPHLVGGGSIGWLPYTRCFIPGSATSKPITTSSGTGREWEYVALRVKFVYLETRVLLELTSPSTGVCFWNWQAQVWHFKSISRSDINPLLRKMFGTRALLYKCW